MQEIAQKIGKVEEPEVVPVSTATAISDLTKYQKFLSDEKGGARLRSALKNAGSNPNRHERRQIDAMARKYGITGEAAIGYWRQGLRHP